MQVIKILVRLITIMYIAAFTVAAVVMAGVSCFGPDSPYTFLCMVAALILLVYFFIKQKLSLNRPLPKPAVIWGVCALVVTIVCSANNQHRLSSDGSYLDEDYPLPDSGYSNDYDNTYGDGYDTGYDAGYEDTYDTGYDAGYDAGYDNTYDAGYDDGDDSDYGNENASEIIENLGNFEYPLSEVTNLSGLFSLDSGRQVLEQAPQTLTSRSIWVFDNTEYGNQNDPQYARLGYSDFLPLTVDRSNGEKLVLVGDEWDRRAESRKEQIESYATRLVGYGNPYLLPGDDEINSFETIMGLQLSKIEATFPDIWNTDFSEILADIADVNTILAETPFRVHLYDESQNYGQMGYLLLSNRYQETLTYGEYVGTEYVTTNVAMITPYFLYDADVSTSLPIVPTMDGYFVIDISSLPNGMYAIDSVSGSYIINIK